MAVTKSDLAEGQAAVDAVAEEVQELLAAAARQSSGAAGDQAALAPLVESAQQAAQLAAAAHCSQVSAPGAPLCVPLFPTSSVTGAGLALLHSFLYVLQPAGSEPGWDAQGTCERMQGWCGGGAAGAAGGAHFQIDSSFEVVGVGTGK